MPVLNYSLSQWKAEMILLVRIKKGWKFIMIKRFDGLDIKLNTYIFFIKNRVCLKSYPKEQLFKHTLFLKTLTNKPKLVY